MFKNERLGITIPQQEHARFAGVLAFNWGNDTFDKPRYGMEALTKGVTFHHTGYGINDTVAFEEMSEKDLVGIFERDIQVDLQNVDAELVNLFHQLRLIKNRIERSGTDTLDEVQNTVERIIETKLALSKLKREDFERSNSIVHVCDRVSFNFCFGKIIESEIPVFTRNSDESVLVQHTIDHHGVIQINPWPFAISNFEGFVIGYSSDQYPDQLIPQILRYRVAPSTK
ncbi:hypothetical protein A3F59_02010 [Candidatus Roizmanbacteria bacterium RIFCSPHIGHO2_12_FULL_38_13]|nr:MAG: hypothetical protein A2905_03820 [Candidatus Levybacteria bacterium RIFCSPLOWO2_01_FULL_36_10]OGK35694.1 MAG: hypothetical protein A3F59_02010 [Candidatus Roizmanbacteria bacterium RIFCSPHIGHO2_12_FULL_38_13]